MMAAVRVEVIDPEFRRRLAAAAREPVGRIQKSRKLRCRWEPENVDRLDGGKYNTALAWDWIANQVEYGVEIHEVLYRFDEEQAYEFVSHQAVLVPVYVKVAFRTQWLHGISFHNAKFSCLPSIW